MKKGLLSFWQTDCSYLGEMGILRRYILYPVFILINGV